MPNRLPLNPDQLAAYQAGQPEETTADAVALNHEITRALGGVGLPLETTLNKMGESTPVTTGEFGELPGDFRDKLTATHQATEKLFARIGLMPPSIDAVSLINANIDPMHLMSDYNGMAQEGHQPELVLSPLLTAQQWQGIYTLLTADTTIPGNPLKTQDDGRGLYINGEVKAAWDKLNFLPEGVTVINGNANTGTGTQWTLRVIPGTPKPTQTNIDHNGNYKDGTQLPNVAHPTVNEYLTLQATLIQNGEPPIDAQTWSWLDGTFGDNNSQAPAGGWGPAYGQVLVRCYDVGFRFDGLGVRVPVWG